MGSFVKCSKYNSLGHECQEKSRQPLLAVGFLVYLLVWLRLSPVGFGNDDEVRVVASVVEIVPQAIGMDLFGRNGDVFGTGAWPPILDMVQQLSQRRWQDVCLDIHRGVGIIRPEGANAATYSA